jgi:hypothetical protein
MKYTLVALVAVLGLSACADLKANVLKYTTNEQRCQLRDVVVAKAAEQKLPVEEYLKVNDIFMCAEVEAGKLKAATE